MSKTTSRPVWRLQAVARNQSQELPEEALAAFEQAAQQMDRPGAFESRAIAVHGEAFTALTGFSPLAGEYIPPEAVKRGVEFATPARIKALINARSALRNDYIALGVFLRVCASNGLGLKAAPFAQPARR